MVQNKINKLIKNEINWYYYYLYKNNPVKFRKFLSWMKYDKVGQIATWQKYSRYTDYYRRKMKSKGNLIYKILYLYNLRNRNILGQKLGLEIDTDNIDFGLKILHGNIVINSNALIGKNLILLGSNVIGNGGPGKLGCPKIGNNVIIGAGAKVIGNIRIADDILIASGAVVVDSFTEKGIIIGGIPAKRIK